MQQSFIFSAIKVAFIDIALDILNFPVWWYSRGFVKALKASGASLYNSYRDLAIGILFKNMFKPMYGEYSLSGRLISFFARIFILLFKLTQFLIWLIILLVMLILWLALPWVVIYKIISYGISS
jgi:hypothetical protein